MRRMLYVVESAKTEEEEKEKNAREERLSKQPFNSPKGQIEVSKVGGYVIEHLLVIVRSVKPADASNF